MGRQEFFASPRVSTYLSTVSRFEITVNHVSGVAFLPSDYARRNAPECMDPSCQICKFIAEESVVRHLSVEDVLSGRGAEESVVRHLSVEDVLSGRGAEESVVRHLSVEDVLSGRGAEESVVRHLSAEDVLSGRGAEESVVRHLSVEDVLSGREAEEAIVRHLSAEDVLSDRGNPPFTSRKTWLSIQSECADLRRTHAHLIQGTRPSKKST